MIFNLFKQQTFIDKLNNYIRSEMIAFVELVDYEIEYS